ncbi:MAG: glycosyltransferase [Solirubrobacteraceae bacterium]
MSICAPDPRLRTVVVVPAHNEEQRIVACLRALAGQIGVAGFAYEVLLVLDRCTDATRARACASARASADGGPKLALHMLESPLPGPGVARRTGMELACDRLLAVGRPHGLIASTDADSVVAPDWLSVQLALVDGGARAIGGELELDPVEAARLPAGTLADRGRQARVRIEGIVDRDRDRAEHHFFSGASLALTAETYRAIGGLPQRAALEDEALQRALEDGAVPIVRPRSVSVRTSARIDGRADRGLARDLGRAAW